MRLFSNFASKRNPVQALIYNKRLNYKAYLYEIPSGYQLSLLPSVSLIEGAIFFGKCTTTDPKSLHIGSSENPDFIKLLHETIATSKDSLEYLLSSRARMQVSGWLHLIDERSPISFGRTPDSDDIIGMVYCENGLIVPETYSPMPSYRLISPLGIFSLPKVLQIKLINKLASLN